MTKIVLPGYLFFYRNLPRRKALAASMNLSKQSALKVFLRALIEPLMLKLSKWTELSSVVPDFLQGHLEQYSSHNPAKRTIRRI